MRPGLDGGLDALNPEESFIATEVMERFNEKTRAALACSYERQRCTCQKRRISTSGRKLVVCDACVHACAYTKETMAQMLGALGFVHENDKLRKYVLRSTKLPALVVVFSDHIDAELLNRIVGRSVPVTYTEDAPLSRSIFCVPAWGGTLLEIGTLVRQSCAGLDAHGGGVPHWPAVLALATESVEARTALMLQIERAEEEWRARVGVGHPQLAPVRGLARWLCDSFPEVRKGAGKAAARTLHASRRR